MVTAVKLFNVLQLKEIHDTYYFYELNIHVPDP